MSFQRDCWWGDIRDSCTEPFNTDSASFTSPRPPLLPISLPHLLLRLLSLSSVSNSPARSHLFSQRCDTGFRELDRRPYFRLLNVQNRATGHPVFACVNVDVVWLLDLTWKSSVESCGNDAGDVLVIELEKLVDNPGTKIGTRFTVLHCIFLSFSMRCGF